MNQSNVVAFSQEPKLEFAASLAPSLKEMLAIEEEVELIRQHLADLPKRERALFLWATAGIPDMIIMTALNLQPWRFHRQKERVIRHLHELCHRPDATLH